MKKVLAVTAVATFALTPAIGAACDYDDASSASATPPVLAGSAPTQAATKASTTMAAKTVAPNALKQVAGKVKAPVSDKKIAGTTN